MWSSGGGPGEGKSTLAFLVAQRLCAQWQQQPKPKDMSGTANAHKVDLRGEHLKRNVYRNLPADMSA